MTKDVIQLKFTTSSHAWFSIGSGKSNKNGL